MLGRVSLIVAAIFCLISPAGAKPLRVVASIGPVHSLVQGVMGPTAKVDLLIPGGQSPHLFSMRPSTARAIARADVVFRIAPDYEIALDAPLRTARGQVIDLIEAPGLTLYPARDLAHHESQNAALHAREIDPHIWLDPTNARTMTRWIAEALSRADSAHQETYQLNEEIVEAWLIALDSAIKSEVRPIRGAPFIVFHDGYQYFERRYGLAFAGAVTEMPGKLPGARHISLLRQEMASEHVRCVFVEPQFEPRLLATVTEALPIKAGTLDMLGADLPPGEVQYFEMMRGLSRSLRSCLIS